MEVIIKDVIQSETAISPRTGEILFNYLDRVLSSGEKIILNFQGIEYLTTAFLNVAIGQLYHKYRPDQLNDSITLVNLQREDISLFKKVISRAKDYFKDQESFNNKMDQHYNGE